MSGDPLKESTNELPALPLLFPLPTIDSFTQGAIDENNLPKVFIDPNQLDREYYDNNGIVAQHDIDALRQKLFAVSPDISANYDNETLGVVLENSITIQGANVLSLKDICIITKPGSDMDPSLFTGIDNAYTAPNFSISTNELHRSVGVHEGQHCEQNDSVSQIVKNPAQRSRIIFEMELEADRSAMNDLRQQGRHDLVEEFRDLRALESIQYAEGMPSPPHSTGILLDEGDNTPLNDAQAEAAGAFRERIYESIADAHGITRDEAVERFIQSPTAEVQTIQEQLDNGYFDNEPNPYTKEYVEAYADAYERRVTDPNNAANYYNIADSLREAPYIKEMDPDYVQGAHALESYKAGYQDLDQTLDDLGGILDDPATNPKAVNAFYSGYGAQMADIDMALNPPEPAAPENTFQPFSPNANFNAFKPQ